METETGKIKVSEVIFGPEVYLKESKNMLPNARGVSWQFLKDFLPENKSLHFLVKNAPLMSIHIGTPSGMMIANHLHRLVRTMEEIGEVINPAKSNVSNICSEFPDLEKQNESLLDSYIPYLGVAGRFNMPVISTNIKNYIEQQLLDEKHLREITSISNVQYLSPLLTPHQVLNKNRVTEGNLSEMVSLRLKLHAMSERVKNFANQGELTETHLIQISQLQIDWHPWLTTHQACNKNGIATGDLIERHLDALTGITPPSQLSHWIGYEVVQKDAANNSEGHGRYRRSEDFQVQHVALELEREIISVSSSFVDNAALVRFIGQMTPQSHCQKGEVPRKADKGKHAKTEIISLFADDTAQKMVFASHMSKGNVVDTYRLHMLGWAQEEIGNVGISQDNYHRTFLCKFPDLEKSIKNLLDSGILRPDVAERFNMPSPWVSSDGKVIAYRLHRQGWASEETGTVIGLTADRLRADRLRDFVSKFPAMEKPTQSSFDSGIAHLNVAERFDKPFIVEQSSQGLTGYQEYFLSQFPDMEKEIKKMLDSGIPYPGVAECFNMPSRAVGLTVQPVKDFLSALSDFSAKWPKGPILGENGSLEEVNPDGSEPAQEKTFKIPAGQILFANHTDLDPLSIYNSYLSEGKRSC